MEAYRRVNMSPMGAGALATTSFPINRERVAELLGFNGIVENSIDAVGSRDFLLEVQSCLVLAALNVGRMAEDLILWSSLAFGMIDLPDEFTSTSSIMPQKKNPEVLEIIRARIGDVIGDFVAAVTTMKSLPSGYNLDLQELTLELWETIECFSSSLSMLTALLPLLKVSSIKPELFDFSTSTELANMLVRKHGIPFRSAHRIVGTLVQKLVEQKRGLSGTTPELLESISKQVVGHPVKVSQKEIRSSINPLQVVEAHGVKGGPSPGEISRALVAREQTVSSQKEKLSKEADRLQKSAALLQSLVEQYLSSKHD
jgi:argininosuccinate lyase